MDSLFGIPILPLHIGAVLATLAAVLYADHLGFLYFRGKRYTLDLRTMRRLHHAVWAGVCLIAATGLLMFSAAPAAYLSYTPFLAKMSFVAILVVNAFFIGKLLPLSSERPFFLLSDGEKKKLFLSAALSSLGWAGALFTALWYLGYEWLDLISGLFG